METKKVKAVIFDMDGTLADTVPFCITAYKTAIAPYLNRPICDEEILAAFGPSDEGVIQSFLPDHYEKALPEYYELYEKLHSLCPDLFCGIAELLHLLKTRGIRIAMVTGKGKITTTLSLIQYGLSDEFEIIQTGSPAGYRKTEAIQLVVKKLKVVPSEAVYIGDSAADMMSGRKAFVQVFAAAWSCTADIQQLKATHPDETFTSVADLHEYFEIMTRDDKSS